jgi:hypothetical protein
MKINVGHCVGGGRKSKEEKKERKQLTKKERSPSSGDLEAQDFKLRIAYKSFYCLLTFSLLLCFFNTFFLSIDIDTTPRTTRHLCNDHER